MFAVLFPVDNASLFRMSAVRVGRGVSVLSPQMEGEFADITLVSTSEPLLDGPVNLLPFIPWPVPQAVC